MFNVLEMKQDKRSGIYSSMAHAFLALPAAASAQVISIPLDPDIHLVAGGAFTEDSYSLDLDADGLYDIQFQITRLFSSYSQLALVNARLQPLGDASAGYYSVMGTGCYGTYSRKMALPVTSGAAIDETIQFDDLTGQLYYFNNYCGTSFAFGENHIATGIFPFQLNKPEGLYYGWVRLSLIQEGTGAGNYNTHMYIHEAGLAENPDVPVTVEVVDSVHPIFIQLQDIGDNLTGADLQFSIQAATYDEQVSKYRVFIHPVSSPSIPTTEELLLLNEDHYVEISPDGSLAYTGQFDAGHLTWDGTAITNNVFYHLYLLTMPMEESGIDTTLVRTYTPIRLQTAIQDIALSYLQTANNALASDLTVQFTDSNPLITDHYRICISPIDDLPSIASIKTLPATSYYDQIPDGSTSFSVTLPAEMLDTNGDALVYDQDYYIQVLLVGNAAAPNDALFVDSESFRFDSATQASAAQPSDGWTVQANSEQILISYPNAPDHIQYQIISLQGGSLMRGILDAGQTTIKHLLPAGIYFVQVADSQFRSVKISIQ